MNQYALFEKRTGRWLNAGPWRFRRDALAFRDWYVAIVKGEDVVTRRVDGDKQGKKGGRNHDHRTPRKAGGDCGKDAVLVATLVA